MPRTQTRPAGRPRSKSEITEKRHEIKFKPSEYELLEQMREETGVPIGTFIKRAINEKFDVALEKTEPSQTADPLEAFLSGGDTFQLMEMVGVNKSLPVLGSAPCGPLAEVLEGADAKHALSPTTWRWLESQAGDFFIICDGQSMEGAGIPDNALLMFRPLPDNGRPRAGEVALVQFFDEDGGCTSTIKRWMKSEPLTLHDGEGQAITIPDQTNAVPVAVARGMVTRYF